MSTPRRLAAALVCCALALSLAGPAAADEFTAQIWNGRNVPDGAHANVVLVSTKTGQCTGTVIAPRWILTAAHCLEDVPAQPVMIGVGGTRLADGFDEVFVSRVHAVHARRGFSAFDFGLVKLPRRTRVAPVQLAARNDVDLWAPGSPATAVGWGTTDGEGSGGRRLKEAAISVARDRVCGNDFPTYMPEYMVCAETSSASPCPGDSGGPLFVESGSGPVQIGVTSFGRRNCEHGDGVAYGWVPAASRWIERKKDDGIARFRTAMVAGVARERIRRGRRVGVGTLLARRSDFAPLGVQTVKLYRRPAGTDRWRFVGKRVTDVQGFAQLRHRPRRTTHYQWRHPKRRMTLPSRTTRVTVEVVR